MCFLIGLLVGLDKVVNGGNFLIFLGISLKSKHSYLDIGVEGEGDKEVEIL